MAAPNLRSPSTIIGKTTAYPVTGTLAQVLSNSAASGKVFKVNTIRCANVDGVSAASLDVSLFRSATHYYLIKGISIDAGKALIVSDKNEYIYLEEGDALYAKASAASDLELTVNYEEIS